MLPLRRGSATAGELLGGPSVTSRLAQAIPTFTSEIMDVLVCARAVQSFCEHLSLTLNCCVNDRCYTAAGFA